MNKYFDEIETLYKTKKNVFSIKKFSLANFLSVLLRQPRLSRLTLRSLVKGCLHGQSLRRCFAS